MTSAHVFVVAVGLGLFVDAAEHCGMILRPVCVCVCLARRVCEPLDRFI